MFTFALVSVSASTSDTDSVPLRLCCNFFFIYFLPLLALPYMFLSLFILHYLNFHSFPFHSLPLEMQMRVKFRSESGIVDLSGSRHSGGERAVSTVMYLMALQDLTSAPFRVVDGTFEI